MAHVVVDGSNIATEGRTIPSLKQLDEAVRAYLEEYPDDSVTVVVDATFGHRIDPSEVAAFDEAVENNELVSPPAGAIGRGDAFVLQIANKANARILSNDSFQEFHGTYDWLFDEGRLIGGKPVPHVGWVFVLRAPVRGPASRRAVRDARGRKQPAAKVPTTLPSLPPLPSVPGTPPPGKARRRGGSERRATAPVADAAAVMEAAIEAAQEEAAARPAAPVVADAAVPRTSATPTTNEALPFLEFIPAHPVGTVVEGVVESFSSHGAYVRIGELSAYIPLRYLGSPAPKSAREVVRIGEERRFVVVAFDATRRGIDLALPGFAPPGVVELVPAAVGASASAPVADAQPAADTGRGRRRRGGRTAEAAEAAEPVAPVVEAPTRGRRRGRTPVPETTAPETTAPETTAPETTAPETTAPDTTAPEAPAVEAEAAPTTRRRRTRAAAAAAPEAEVPSADAAAATPSPEPAPEAEPATSPAVARRRSRMRATGTAEAPTEAAAPAEVEPEPVPARAVRRTRKAAASPAVPEATPEPVAPVTPPAKAARAPRAKKATAPAEAPVTPPAKAPAKRATKKAAAAAAEPAAAPVPAKRAAKKAAAPAGPAPAKAPAAKKRAPTRAKKAAESGK